GWSLSLAYAVLMWPLVAGASGLYPGYGMSAHQELAASVKSAAAAALIVALATVVLPGTYTFPAPALLVSVLASVVLAPAIRAIVKVMLRALHLWGRAVVMLGSGLAAQRTAAHLLEHPGVGL